MWPFTSKKPEIQFVKLVELFDKYSDDTAEHLTKELKRECWCQLAQIPSKPESPQMIRLGFVICGDSIAVADRFEVEIDEDVAVFMNRVTTATVDQIARFISIHER